MRLAEPFSRRKAILILAVPSLSEVEGGRRNNLNLVRVVLASMVILSHCYVILGRFADEPMQRALHFNDLGGTAVYSFFYLSGFLIFKSALRSTPERFVIARALRIFPALIAASLLCALVIGPLATTLSPAAYFRAADTWRYIGTGLLHIEHSTLPGVFTDRAGQVVNQPLWTLPAEWLMYMAMWLLCIGLAFHRAHGPAPARLILIVLVLAYTLTLPFPILKHALPWFCFAAAGAITFVAKRYIPLSIPAAVALVCACLLALLTVPVAGKILFAPALAYLLLVVSFHPALHVGAYHRAGDYSYGLYVYAWPFQQLLVGHAATPMTMFALVFPIALAIAAVSWHGLERPCLGLKDAVARRLSAGADHHTLLHSEEATR